MKRLFVYLGLLLMAGWLLFGRSQDPRQQIGRQLGVDLSAGRVILEADSHGGFHGDGLRMVQISFEGDTVGPQLQNQPEWRPLPPDADVQALLYGVQAGGVQLGPFLADGEGSPLAPQAEQGFYRLIDRHAQAGQEGPGLLQRGSLNFSLALYDADACTLYYFALDT